MRITLCLVAGAAFAARDLSWAASAAECQATPNLQALLNRVAVLEAKVKELASGQIEAPLIVVDSKGQEVMSIDVGADGPALTLRWGSSRSILKADELAIRGQDGNGGGALIAVGKSGNGGQVLFDARGKPMYEVAYAKDLQNRLALRMWAKDQVMVELGDNQNDAGAGALKLGNGKGQFTAEIGTNGRQQMAMRVRNATGQVLVGVGESPDGHGGGELKVANGQGQILTNVVALPAAGHVNVFTPDGKAVANLGAEGDGRGFVRIGSAKNGEAVALTTSAAGVGNVQVRNVAGVGVELGVKTYGAKTWGDLCAISSLQKMVCLSMLAAKAIMPY